MTNIIRRWLSLIFKPRHMIVNHYRVHKTDFEKMAS